MRDQMIDRVARAIWEHRAKQVRLEYPDLLPLEGWGAVAIANGVMGEARAAIEAMREPTEAMQNAGSERGWTPPTGAMIWQAMIDAALNEETVASRGEAK